MGRSFRARMKEIRGPGHSVPDSIPEELVAVYGQQARHTVRYRRSLRYRLARHIGRRLSGLDVWYVVAAALLWAVISGAAIAAIVLAAMQWPGPTLDAVVIAAVSVVSSTLTLVVIRRRDALGR